VVREELIDARAIDGVSVMHAFAFEARIPRVVFGAGSLQHLAREIDRLGAKRALILSTPEQADSAHRIAEMLGTRAAGVLRRQ